MGAVEVYVAFSKAATFTSDVSLNLIKSTPLSKITVSVLLICTEFKDMFTTKTFVSLFLFVGMSSLTKGSLLISYPFHGYG